MLLNVDRREKILQAAERLISHYGLAKTTVGDIATEAKVGVGTVYLEFSSKDAIVAEIASQAHVEAFSYVSVLEGEPTPDKLRLFLERRLTRFAFLWDKPHGLDFLSCNCIDVGAVKARFFGEEQQKLVEFLSSVSESPEESAKLILTLHSSFEDQACGEQQTPELFGAYIEMAVRSIFGNEK